MTELMREKLLQLCTEAESILTPKDDSRIMYLGLLRLLLLFIVSWQSGITDRLFGQHDTQEITPNMKAK